MSSLFTHNYQSLTAEGVPLPVGLRTTIKFLSGYDLEDVRVYYNSTKPEQIRSLAYAYGIDIYLGTGQEKYLAHEAWHVVQQKQGRVKPTGWLENGAGINTDEALEKEAELISSLLDAALSEDVLNGRTQHCKPESRERSSDFTWFPVIQCAGLEYLVQPKVNQLIEPDVALQDDLMKKLSKKVEEDDAFSTDQVYHLCSLNLLRSSAGFEFQLIPPEIINHVSLYNGYKLIEDDILLQVIIKSLIESSLKLAGQLAYLWYNDLPNQGWRIYVDVHFYYQRSLEAAGFHRDTVGRTMFVNLNYNNSAPIIGPELLIDLTKYEQHYEQVKTSLPPVFLTDIEKLQSAPDVPNVDPDKIDVLMIPQKGIVSWVDELVDHSTPYLGHRGLSFGEIMNYLSFKFQDIAKFIRLKTRLLNPNPITAEDLNAEGWNDSDAAFILSNGQVGDVGEIAGRLSGQPGWNDVFSQHPLIDQLIDLMKSKPDQLFQKQLLLLNGIPADEVDAMFYYFQKPNLEQVNITYANDDGARSTLNPVRPVLTRTMSQELIKHGVDRFTPSPEKRQFLRTWVQAVKTDLL